MTSNKKGQANKTLFPLYMQTAKAEFWNEFSISSSFAWLKICLHVDKRPNRVDKAMFVKILMHVWTRPENIQWSGEKRCGLDMSSVDMTISFSFRISGVRIAALDFFLCDSTKIWKGFKPSDIQNNQVWDWAFSGLLNGHYWTKSLVFLFNVYLSSKHSGVSSSIHQYMKCLFEGSSPSQ